MSERKVIAAMSGGVDSSLAAQLLLEKGYQVIGVTMRLMPFGGESSCCGLEAVEEAKRVADRLGIPHYILDFKEEFEKEVVEYFCREYSIGRTPNPCIICNQKLKFGKLLEKAKELGAEYVASGHYAQLTYEGGGYRLRKGRDKTKDQSYVLFNLTQGQLKHILMPLGGLEKKEVRRRARELGLRVHERPDSQEICFIPDGHYSDFLTERIPEVMRPGPIEDRKGKILGQHRGIHSFTIGQRRGLGIVTGEPLYVIAIDSDKNTVVVGSREDLYGRELIATEISWITREKSDGPMEVKAKLRYRHPGSEATVLPLSGRKAKVIFRLPQKAITPGQAVVFYQGEEVIGGGWIKASNGWN